MLLALQLRFCAVVGCPTRLHDLRPDAALFCLLLPAHVPQTGDVHLKITTAMDSSRVVLVFIDDRFVTEATLAHEGLATLTLSHCKKKKKQSHVIPVVMDPAFSHPRSWTGPVGEQLGRLPFVDLTGDIKAVTQGLDHLFAMIETRLKNIAGTSTTRNAGASTAHATDEPSGFIGYISGMFGSAPSDANAGLLEVEVRRADRNDDGKKGDDSRVRRRSRTE